jgi:hypothetical protein
MATAGLVADVFLQTIAQALFALFGATLLARIVGPTILPPVLLGAAAACIVLGAFYVAHWQERPQPLTQRIRVGRVNQEVYS